MGFYIFIGLECDVCIEGGGGGGYLRCSDDSYDVCAGVLTR